MGKLIKKWIWKVNTHYLSIFLDINIKTGHFMKAYGKMTFRTVKAPSIIPIKKNLLENVNKINLGLNGEKCG